MRQKSRHILGIDEAGRGCVLGPMVITGVLFEADRETFEVLQASGIKDSKLLTATKRADLAKIVLRLKKATVTVTVSPRKIDTQSLNSIEIERSAHIIDRLKPDDVYLDVPAVGLGIQNYCSNILKTCAHKDVVIIGGNHFDDIHLVVAAASILAKERREFEVKKLHKKFGDFGSGYASDPRTQAWLSSWRSTGARWPSLVRTKWETVSRLR